MLARLLPAAALALCAAGQPPAQEAVISRIRQAALDYGNSLQNFTCVQTMTRSIGGLPTGPKWKRLESQELELNYVDHQEHYKLLKVNGETTELERRIKQGYFKGVGQFGSALQNIFDPKAQAEFEWSQNEPAAGEGVCVLRYRVSQASTTIEIIADQDRRRVGHHGTIWANCETGAVKRFITETDPAEVRRLGRRVAIGYILDVRYGPATIGDREFLLPQSAVQTAVFYKTWTKAEIQFSQYRKYDASSTLKFEGR